jgi:hypothetical protein
VSISVLFARRDSVYKTIPNCDVWDEERDARKWVGPGVIVAHPPCRAWGGMRHLATNVPEYERGLAIWSIEQIRKHGGVLEHPRRSELWPHLNLPVPGKGKDEYGGWTLGVHQLWWGHRAEKATLLYIVGCEPGDIPTIPGFIGEAQFCVGTKMHRRDYAQNHKATGRPIKPEITKQEREHTPREFAEWLIELASRCSKP